jgi:hypothetical protein
MKKGKYPQNTLSLTSDQIGETLAQSFWGALKASRKLYPKDSAAHEHLIPEDLKWIDVAGKPHFKGTNKRKGKQSKRPGTKGHVSIRSQTGHDHDRNHQKY